MSVAIEITGSPETGIHGYIEENRDKLRSLLIEHGAVLLRGFGVGGVDGFDGVVRAFSGSAPLTYAERSSPRSTIKGQVYTSTDYPPDEEIFLHNENSYQAAWPHTLYFYCIEPALTRGATPLADIREVYRSIDPAVREEFERRGWRVVRNFHTDFGVPWQETFGTDDRAAVEEYCRGKGLAPLWRPDGGLRTTALRRAVHTHPVTGDSVWFNHATFFHVTSLAPEVREGLREIFPEEDLPTNTYYGDGGRIPDEVMDHLRSAYRAASTRFDWQRDDVLVVDNMLAAHGREPFTGPRKIAVAMADPSA
ncbi:TauD/TfdA family dioxygenase [Streptomyces sp. APSN-46.1]|uniref:TauD/TfdA family dioxygenase n=1 Tax=Streptomyces sp. APSN-46.1 TaxID=2929049 RepID=UPI001FB53703|nr:TauD/TfdA family dioxygenase [Streptomyces sp. APSN-46.1]MCJ1678514.1 TauD/TfdA family dioxygenase [Streptomyces sp. APSN-46.1]